MAFYSDLIVGENAEKELAEILILKYNIPKERLYKIPGNFKYFDFILVDNTGSVKTYEVKLDRKAKTTGNIAFEYLSNGKSGSIMTSKSDYLVYCIDGDGFYMAETEKIKKYIIRDMENRYVNGGDNKRQTLLLLPLMKFKELFNKL